MIAIDVADLVVIAGELYGTGPDAALEQIDLDAARAALTEAALTEAALTEAALTEAALTESPPAAAATAAPVGTALTKDALAAAATRLIRALLCHHPFPADGQQLAVLAGLQFLALNGWQADLDPPGRWPASARARARYATRSPPYSPRPARAASCRTG